MTTKINPLSRLAALGLLDALTYELLNENGQIDAREGKDMHTGWKELATEMGMTNLGRTPAREAYEDGWYSASAGTK